MHDKAVTCKAVTCKQIRAALSGYASHSAVMDKLGNHFHFGCSFCLDPSIIHMQYVFIDHCSA